MTNKHESPGASDDAIFTALYFAAEQTQLPHEPSYEVERGLERFSTWLDNHTNLVGQTTIQKQLAGISSARRQRRAGRVVPAATRLLIVAARLFPSADRARYAEEYQSELWDLAQSGAGSLRQLRYALRQLTIALPTGSALRYQRRKSVAR